MKKILLFIIGIGLILITILLYYGHNKRIAIYNYDTALDYQYDFNNTDVRTFELTITDGKISLPKFSENDLTAFLKIVIQPSLTGKLLAPEIIVQDNDGNTVIGQQFEIGAAGVRYLNISTVVNTDLSEINLKAKHANFNNGKTQLYLFENENIINKRILILAPHPDDAEIAAYGLYSTYPENTFIVTVTAGDAVDFKYDEIFSDSLRHYREKGRVRTWNSLTVPLLGGVAPENIANLGYYDEALPLMFQKDSVPVQTKYTKSTDLALFRSQNRNNLISAFEPPSSTWKSLRNDMIQLLDTIRPDIILTPYPKLDSHLDHKYTTIALVEALKKLNIQKGNLFLYTNHLPESDAYPFGEEGQPVTLPPNFDGAIYFKSILSFSLSKKIQQEKILALDAMNDLRLDTEYRNTKGAFTHAFKMLKRKTVGPDIDYFRRAVRSNELFFVVPVVDVYHDAVWEQVFGMEN